MDAGAASRQSAGTGGAAAAALQRFRENPKAPDIVGGLAIVLIVLHVVHAASTEWNHKSVGGKEATGFYATAWGMVAMSIGMYLLFRKWMRDSELDDLWEAAAASSPASTSPSAGGSGTDSVPITPPTRSDESDEFAADVESGRTGSLMSRRSAGSTGSLIASRSDLSDDAPAGAPAREVNVLQEQEPQVDDDDDGAGVFGGGSPRVEPKPKAQKAKKEGRPRRKKAAADAPAAGAEMADLRASTTVCDDGGAQPSNITERSVVSSELLAQAEMWASGGGSDDDDMS